MVRVVFIRHGKTAGNLEKRYIGRLDEPLCQAGRDQLASGAAAGIYDRVLQLAEEGCDIWTSGRLRCIQTGELLFPGREFYEEPELRECDFGRFEGLNWQELTGDRDYQAWIDSGGSLPFPGGEDPADFRRRCVRAFLDIVSATRGGPAGCLIFIVHGGTIMSIMSALAIPERDYYDWHTGNGAFIICSWDGKHLIPDREKEENQRE